MICMSFSEQSACLTGIFGAANKKSDFRFSGFKWFLYFAASISIARSHTLLVKCLLVLPASYEKIGQLKDILLHVFLSSSYKYLIDLVGLLFLCVLLLTRYDKGLARSFWFLKFTRRSSHFIPLKTPVNHRPYIDCVLLSPTKEKKWSHRRKIVIKN